MIVHTITELRRYAQKFMDAPEPPCACASAIVDSPSTRRKPPKVNSAGSNDPACVPNAWLFDSPVRSTHQNGNRVTARIANNASHASTRPQLGLFRMSFFRTLRCDTGGEFVSVLS